ncbi:MAG: radical SAM protein [Planctomycetes bacterium]|nr:radical SAM protein [Planctomycetota bacterium]
MAYDLDILLVNVGGTRKRVYQDLGGEFAAVEPPFWAALTAGYLRKCGFHVDILDANLLNLDAAVTAEAIGRSNARYTAIVVYSQQANTCTPIMTGVGQLCRAVKQRDAAVRLILTGWHPSALPERTLREEACDMVVQGEGFYTLRDLLQDKPLREVPGLWWKEGGEVLRNGRAANVADLTGELGDVAWDLLPLAGGGYRAFNWMCLQDLDTRNHYASMFTSLGCPYRCSFCAIHATFGDRRVRYWSPEWALRQMGVLAAQYGVKHINLIDELFVFKPEHYVPIAEGLVERNYGLNFCAFARVDRVDAMSDDELRLLKRAGFNWLKLGIESIAEEVLRRAHKGRYTRDVVRRVVRRIHDAGIDLCANFMFGLPGDTWDTMQDNLNFAMELNCAFPSFFCAMAPPGSDLYQEALAKGIPLPETWTGYAQQGYDFLPLPTEHLSAADVLAFRDYAFTAYFANPRYLRSIEAKFGPAARDHVERMTRIELKRKLLGD